MTASRATFSRAIFDDVARDALFLVWGPPSLGPRSRTLARELAIKRLHFVYCTTRRGLLWAPVKYPCQAARTLLLLLRERPRTVFVQSPPSLAVLFVYVYCALTGSRYVVDAHSAAFQSPFWTRPRWLHALLARRAVATLVTNDYLADEVRRSGGVALVIPDVPTVFPTAEPLRLDGGFNVAVVNTFSRDEPLREVLQAAAGLEGVEFHVTGRKARAPRDLLAAAPPNVHFTDFLTDEAYYTLLASSQAVMCLTTRDHTMQRGACEALWLGKPIITSDWPLLRTYFHRGTVHVRGTDADLRRGVLEMRDHHSRYRAEIEELQNEHRRGWEDRVEVLANLLRQAGGGKEK